MAKLSRRSFLGSLAGAAVGLLARPLTPSVLAAGKRIEVICRDAWGAVEPTGDFRRHRIRRLTIHHSGVALRDNRDAPARFRSHQRSHQARGWPDIAYHLLIDRNGNVYEGRPIGAVGDTATNYDPKGHLGVLCEGHFGEQRPSPEQLQALTAVLAWASARYGVAPELIRAHQDYADTACPGTSMYRRVGEVRRGVKQRLASGGVRRVEMCGDAGTQRVADIAAGID
ncbi:MAG TPA: peptidoglycan recognition family protein [Actinomycetota bacterium]|nr:peptidoglycan recognition family protein [Actinomycetota bacterium]